MGTLIVCQIRQIFNLGLDKGGTSLGLDSLPREPAVPAPRRPSPQNRRPYTRTTEFGDTAHANLVTSTHRYAKHQ